MRDADTFFSDLVANLGKLSNCGDANVKSISSVGRASRDLATEDSDENSGQRRLDLNKLLKTACSVYYASEKGAALHAYVEMALKNDAYDHAINAIDHIPYASDKTRTARLIIDQAIKAGFFTVADKAADKIYYASDQGDAKLRIIKAARDRKVDTGKH